jgi:tRNA dimethylallyltransferase
VTSPVNPLVAIVGPTGSGKSDLSLRLAEQFQGEVVNCDSLQIYRHFNIGTAKTAEEHRRGIPHHLIDVLDPDELFTAGEYGRRARSVVREITARGRLPVIAGGTGFYLRALIEGLFPGPQRDSDLRSRLAAREERRPGSLHRILARLDPPTSARIHPNDLPKVTRALEICLLTRRPATEAFRQGRTALEGYRILKLGLNPDRDGLYSYLDERCRRMFELGLIDEVRHILGLGFAPPAKPFESHGYRQALQLMNGELTATEAVFYAQRNTRQYAKRQLTWFRRESGVEWLRGFGSEPAIEAEAIRLTSEFLAGE